MSAVNLNKVNMTIFEIQRYKLVLEIDLTVPHFKK